MSFFTFLLYDMIIFFIKVILLFILFYIFKDKLSDLILNKQLDKTFDDVFNKSILDIDTSNLDNNCTDDPQDTINMNTCNNLDSTDFVDTIHIIDNTK